MCRWLGHFLHSNFFHACLYMYLEAFCSKLTATNNQILVFLVEFTYHKWHIWDWGLISYKGYIYSTLFEAYYWYFCLLFMLDSLFLLASCILLIFINPFGGCFVISSLVFWGLKVYSNESPIWLSCLSSWFFGYCFIYEFGTDTISLP